MEREIKICDECESSYFNDSSKMESMCPECASTIYDYKPCEHQFKNNRCIKCHWDGSVSEYIKKSQRGQINEI